MTWEGIALGFFLGLVCGGAGFFLLAMFTTIARDQLWHEVEVEKHKERARQVSDILENQTNHE